MAQKKILIVEDEPDMRAILCGMVENAGYNVVKAEDGEKGLDMIIKEKPDLVLLDIIMPKLNGFEVLEKIQYNPQVQDIPVVILSNLGQEKEVKKGKELGAVDFIVKADVHLTDILDKITKYTEKK